MDVIKVVLVLKCIRVATCNTFWGWNRIKTALSSQCFWTITTFKFNSLKLLGTSAAHNYMKQRAKNQP